jgi:predicted  nucleic acid-binding Zn-ribbon protein
VFSERLKRSIRKNVKKQNRAIALLNKKTALYAHYTNYLRYEYDKYNVRDSKALEATVNEYKTYAATTSRIDTLRETTREAEKRLRAFIKQKNMAYPPTDMEQFAKTAAESMRDVQNIKDEKAALEKRLDALDRRRADIWRMISAAKVGDESKERVVERIIAQFQ